MNAQQVAVALAAGYVAAAVVGVVVGVRLLRGRPSTTSRSFGVALLGGALWSLVVLAANDAPAAVREAVYAVVVVPVIAVVVAAFFCGVLAIARVDWRPSRRTLAILAIHPVVMVAVGATNGLHGLEVTALEGTPELEFGPLFWVHSAYTYGLLVVAGVLAFRARRHAPMLRSRQITTVVAVGGVPAVAIVVQLALLPPEVPDLTPLSFVVVGLIDAHLILRRNALAALPIARSTVLETISDAIVVVDDAGVVVDANLAALSLLTGEADVADVRRSPADDVVGRPAGDVLAVIGLVVDGAAEDGRYTVDLPTGTTVVDLRTRPITGALGRVHGTVVVLRDVTMETEREEELTRANTELRAHVQTIERLRAEVAEQALRDAVTGLHNRRHLDDVLHARLVDDAAAPVGLAILDADHFKLVNDEHGHAAGDRVLEALADALTAGVAPGDTLVRYGGEEFVVVMPGVDAATATARVEDLRARCARARAVTREGAVGVTMSAGLAFAARGTTSPGALLDAADRALYEAKRAGRDRLCVAADVLT